MDPSLLREREAFKKKAFATPVVENRFKKDLKPSSSSANRPNESNQKKRQRKEPSGDQGSALSRMTGSSSHNFAVLAKIVNWMKQRYLDGDGEALSFEDVLDETNQLDLTAKQKNWLLVESLPNNPKIEITGDGKYAYKPLYPLKDRRSLLRLLDKYDSRGFGGIALEDVQESLPGADRHVKWLVENNKIQVIVRPMDKKKILFYNDIAQEIKVDEEFQKLWRSIAVEGIDETKIEEYLQNQGITSMQDMGLKKVVHQKRKKTGNKRKTNFKKLNDHIKDILEDYTEKPPPVKK